MTNTGPAVPGSRSEGSRTDERRTDTRQQIRIIAMELFAEQGYDKTSLREIAERLGVTKAAVYYHFRTKEEIVASLFDDQIAALDELVAWGRTQPRRPGTEPRVARALQRPPRRRRGRTRTWCASSRRTRPR